MFGTLYERNGIYQAQYSIRGEQRRVSLRTRDRAIAESRFQALLARRGVISTPEYYPPDEGKTWEETVRLGVEKYDGWIRRLVQRTRDRATHRGIPCALTVRVVEDMAVLSAGRCALSGATFNWRRPQGSMFPPFAPSIDRIVPADGYHAGNCRLICYAMNVSLSDWGEPVFEELASQYLRARGFHIRRVAPASS